VTCQAQVKGAQILAYSRYHGKSGGGFRLSAIDKRTRYVQTLILDVDVEAMIRNAELVAKRMNASYLRWTLASVIRILRLAVPWD